MTFLFYSTASIIWYLYVSVSLAELFASTIDSTCIEWNYCTICASTVSESFEYVRIISGMYMHVWR